VASQAGRDAGSDNCRSRDENSTAKTARKELLAVFAVFVVQITGAVRRGDPLSTLPNAAATNKILLSGHVKDGLALLRPAPGTASRRQRKEPL